MVNNLLSKISLNLIPVSSNIPWCCISKEREPEEKVRIRYFSLLGELLAAILKEALENSIRLCKINPFLKNLLIKVKGKEK